MERAPEVRNNEQNHRYEIDVDGRTAFLSYRRSGQNLTLVHTDVPEELEGRGYGGALAKAALEDARAAGLKVSPACSFVAAYVRRHPEFANLLDSGYTKK